MHVLVAGGTGVLGRALVPLLVAAGHRVTATTRSASRGGLLRSAGATPVLLDALDRDATVQTVGQVAPDAVVHLMTDLDGGDSTSNARLRDFGTRNLVDAARRAGTHRMVAESISWVYAPGSSPAAETEPLDGDTAEPRRTTVAAVAALEAAVRELPESVVLRFGQLYGPRTWYSADGRYGQDARAGRLPATETVASFVHTSDAAAALLLALGWASGTWNVVDDDPATGHEWAPRFAAAVGAPEPAASVVGATGRPVSNALARGAGLVLRHPSWREGFLTL